VSELVDAKQIANSEYEQYETEIQELVRQLIELKATT
jgi:hypothetical protein